MIEIDGKQVFTELSELVDPAHTALVVVDAMFNDYDVVVADDCVASADPAQHEASMPLMRPRSDIAASAEILAVWEHAPLT